MATKVLFSAEDLERIQALKQRRYELIRGELYEVTTSQRHSEVMARIAMLLGTWNERTGAGRIGTDPGYTFERNPDTVLGPDVAFVAKGRMTREMAARGYAQIAPDLAVEVCSPNDRWPELRAKADFYLSHGTRMVWLVQPDEFVEVLEPGSEVRWLGPEDELQGGDVLRGFSCLVEELFPPQF